MIPPPDLVTHVWGEAGSFGNRPHKKGEEKKRERERERKKEKVHRRISLGQIDSEAPERAAPGTGWNGKTPNETRGEGRETTAMTEHKKLQRHLASTRSKATKPHSWYNVISTTLQVIPGLGSTKGRH